MERSRRFELIEHLSNTELDRAINEAQKADETCLVRRLCFVKGLYDGKTQQQAGEAVGVSQPTSSAGPARGIKTVLRACAHASAAGGRRRSPRHSGKKFVLYLKMVNLGRHARSSHSSKTASALAITQRILLGSFEPQECTTPNPDRWIPGVLKMLRRSSPSA